MVSVKVLQVQTLLTQMKGAVIRIFEDYAFHLINQARKSSITDSDFLLLIDGNVYALDSTTIDLFLSVFWLAEFRKTKGGIKLHTLYDIKTSIPGFIHISNASVNDMNAMDVLFHEPGSYYFFDRGYIYYARLYRVHQSSAFYVARAKDNLQIQRLYSNIVCKENGVLLDQIGRLTGFYVSKKYPQKLRLIKFYYEETGIELEFLTNNLSLKSEGIAQINKYRWKV